MIRMLGYYLSHSFINQIKKLMKTWVLIFLLVCGLLGAGIRVISARLSDQGESVSVESQTEEDASSDQDIADGQTDENAPDQAETGITFLDSLNEFDKPQLVEAALGLITLILFFYAALAADKNGSAVFLPADAALLFPAPLLPQSVMMFRLICRMGTYLALAVILILDLPLFSEITGLNTAGALAFLAALFLVFLYVQLLQTLLYTFTASLPGRRKKVRLTVYVCLFALVGLYLSVLKADGGRPVQSAVKFLSGPDTRWVPVWGWLKGLVTSAANGQLLPCLVYAVLLIAGVILMLALIRRMHADFYEDAMAKSEQTAAMMEEMQQGRAFVLRKKRKDRTDRLQRDGLNKGNGADIFFWKTMYNRYRFAHLHFFTKTSETYLAVSAAAAILGRRAAPEYSVYIPFLALAAFVFFRSLESSMEKDLRSHYFLLVPEKTWKKLFWAELGGLAECLLDLIPGMILAAFLTGASPAVLCEVLLLIMSLYYYSMNVSAFLDSTIPLHLGAVVKQIIQVMFVYFGLLPDVLVLVLGFTGTVKALTLTGSLLLAAAINLVIGMVFMLMIPAFQDPVPRRRRYRVSAPDAEAVRSARKEISLAGFACITVFAVGAILQFTLPEALQALCGEQILESDTALWLMTFLPLYTIAFPIGLAMLRLKSADRKNQKNNADLHTVYKKGGIPAASSSSIPEADASDASRNPDLSEEKAGKKAGKNDIETIPAPERMTSRRLLAAFVTAAFLMYSGNSLGTLLNLFLNSVFGIASQNTVQTLAELDGKFWMVLFAVIIGPVFEELFFRKALIDRLSPLGERFALVFSAAAFGLFHGNLVQLIYAFLIGLLFAYLYIRTGQIRWTIGLHITVNFMGLVVAPLLVNENHIGPAAVCYLIFLGICMLAGMAVLITKAGSVYFVQQSRELPRRYAAKLTWTSPGFLIFLAGMTAAIILSFVSLP